MRSASDLFSLSGVAPVWFLLGRLVGTRYSFFSISRYREASFAIMTIFQVSCSMLSEEC